MCERAASWSGSCRLFCCSIVIMPFHSHIYLIYVIHLVSRYNNKQKTPLYQIHRMTDESLSKTKQFSLSIPLINSTILLTVCVLINVFNLFCYYWKGIFHGRHSILYFLHGISHSINFFFFHLTLIQSPMLTPTDQRSQWYCHLSCASNNKHEL